MRLEAFSTPVTTHLSVAALSISQGGLNGESGWMIRVGSRKREGSEEGNDWVEL